MRSSYVLGIGGVGIVGRLSRSPGPLLGSTSSFGSHAKTVVRQWTSSPEEGCSISHTASSVTRRWRRWSTFLSVVRTRGLPGMIFCFGSAPRQTSHPWGQFCGLVVRGCPGVLLAARKGTSLVIMLMAWFVWKTNNAVIFDGARPDLDCG